MSVEIPSVIGGDSGGGSFDKTQFPSYNELVRTSYFGLHEWRLDESSGAVIDSTVATPVNGTVVGGVTQGALGLLNDRDPNPTSYDFNGTDGRIDFGSSALMTTRSTGIANFWINSDTLIADQTMFDQTNAGGSIFIDFRLTALGGLGFQVRRNGSANQYAVFTDQTPIVAGVTSMVTFRQQNNGTGIEIFVNGSQLSNAGWTITTTGTATIDDWFIDVTTANLPCIGAVRRTVPITFFNGRIAQVYLDSTILTDREIVMLYQTGLGNGPRITAPV